MHSRFCVIAHCVCIFTSRFYASSYCGDPSSFQSVSRPLSGCQLTCVCVGRRDGLVHPMSCHLASGQTMCVGESGAAPPPHPLGAYGPSPPPLCWLSNQVYEGRGEKGVGSGKGGEGRGESKEGSGTRGSGELSREGGDKMQNAPHTETSKFYTPKGLPQEPFKTVEIACVAFNAQHCPIRAFW